MYNRSFGSKVDHVIPCLTNRAQQLLAIITTLLLLYPIQSIEASIHHLGRHPHRHSIPQSSQQPVPQKKLLPETATIKTIKPARIHPQRKSGKSTSRSMMKDDYYQASRKAQKTTTTVTSRKRIRRLAVPNINKNSLGTSQDDTPIFKMSLRQRGHHYPKRIVTMAKPNKKKMMKGRIKQKQTIKQQRHQRRQLQQQHPQYYHQGGGDSHVYDDNQNNGNVGSPRQQNNNNENHPGYRGGGWQWSTGEVSKREHVVTDDNKLNNEKQVEKEDENPTGGGGWSWTNNNEVAKDEQADDEDDHQNEEMIFSPDFDTITTTIDQHDGSSFDETFDGFFSQDIISKSATVRMDVVGIFFYLYVVH